MTAEPDITPYLHALVERAGSDLHLRVGARPMVRLRGELVAVGEVPPLDATELAVLTQSLLDAGQQKRLLGGEVVVVAHSAPGLGRFRIAAFKQRGTASLVVHAVSEAVRPLERLGLPGAVVQLAGASRGLVLVGAPVGNGVTSTLASLVDHTVRNRRGHVVTVDDPIEFLHADGDSLVSQLEVGSDVPGLAEGVRTATRLDADVIAVSELTGPDVAMATIDAVARGALVFAATRGSTVLDVVDGFLDLFPFEERPAMRHTLARSLAGVVAQQLLPGSGGPVLVAEALLNTAKVEAVLRDETRRGEVLEVLRGGTFDGMATLDQSLRDRVRAGLVDEATALAVATEPEELRIELARS